LIGLLEKGLCCGQEFVAEVEETGYLKVGVGGSRVKKNLEAGVEANLASQNV
jgi:hypothetical protein